MIESVKGKGGEYQRRMRTIRATMPAELGVLSMEGVVGLFDQHPGLKVPPGAAGHKTLRRPAASAWSSRPAADPSTPPPLHTCTTKPSLTRIVYRVFQSGLGYPCCRLPLLNKCFRRSP